MDSSPVKKTRRGMEAFAYRDFRRYQLARVTAILGAEAQSVAVAWQVYSLTHRALDLGYTGLALFLPGLVFLLPSGHVADRFDRRQVILVCYSVQVLCTAALLFMTRAGMHSVYPIYAVLLLVGSARSFSGPASSALIPHLVPEKHFVNAVTGGRRNLMIRAVKVARIDFHLLAVELPRWQVHLVAHQYVFWGYIGLSQSLDPVVNLIFRLLI